MEKSIVRNIDMEELNELAAVGGNDTAYRKAPTTKMCQVVATATVVTMTVGMLTTVKEIC
ncbi:hypothetical protein FDF31_07355 [Clostridium sporogenes]|uniref:hypothetical protein n=1 Tax=unclassified Clostridium TaxID=2614128 RepID=UPI0013D8250B|nr:hypothetical protein [Clostridium sporogenes]NFS25457.1 hypothetical protein [Clostridium sporogenes]